MTTTEFRKQAKELGYTIKKQIGLEVFDVLYGRTVVCTITYAELYPISKASEILVKKLRKG